MESGSSLGSHRRCFSLLNRIPQKRVLPVFQLRSLITPEDKDDYTAQLCEPCNVCTQCFYFCQPRIILADWPRLMSFDGNLLLDLQLLCVNEENPPFARACDGVSFTSPNRNREPTCFTAGKSYRPMALSSSTIRSSELSGENAGGMQFVNSSTFSKMNLRFLRFSQ